MRLTVMRAVAGFGLFAMLLLTPTVDTASSASPASPAPAASPASTASAPSTQSTLTTAVESLHAHGDYPLRRRRHLWSNWTSWSHLGGHGPFSWLVFAPLLLIGAAAAAVPLIIRRRRRRQRPQGDSAQPPRGTHDVLARLEELRASGALTDEQFQAQKRRITGPATD
ncbi:MAG: SHOCT domain-containing protein [Mycobacteriaceae bacterium]|nr:SHOCT domain-containing protein [Mycobacteriaceae bacterium]